MSTYSQLLRLAHTMHILCICISADHVVDDFVLWNIFNDSHGEVPILTLRVHFVDELSTESSRGYQIWNYVLGAEVASRGVVGWKGHRMLRHGNTRYCTVMSAMDECWERGPGREAAADIAWDGSDHARGQRGVEEVSSMRGCSSKLRSRAPRRMTTGACYRDRWRSAIGHTGRSWIVMPRLLDLFASLVSTENLPVRY